MVHYKGGGADSVNLNNTEPKWGQKKNTGVHV